MEVNLENINQPTLLVNQNICHNNISKMVDKAERNGIKLRPHFKTHQSSLIASWFRSFGIASIATSSLDMAQYFADHNWDDITVAFPVNIREMSKINALARRIKLQLLVESPVQLEALNLGLKFKVGIFIKIDTGYGRTGLLPNEKNTINGLIQQIDQSNNLSFCGFLAHAGHTYDAQNAKQINAIHEDALVKLNVLKAEYEQKFPDIQVSLGDTPSASVAENFENIDELRPGNFVFYDLKQHQIGACKKSDIAVVVACPIVAIHPVRQEIVVYGGAVHFSKDYIIDDMLGKHFGLVVPLNEKGWGDPLEGCFLKSISQEHGIVKMHPSLMAQYKIGDLMGFLPAHACLVMDKMVNVMTLEGKRVPKMGVNIK